MTGSMCLPCRTRCRHKNPAEVSENAGKSCAEQLGVDGNRTDVAESHALALQNLHAAAAPRPRAGAVAAAPVLPSGTALPAAGHHEQLQLEAADRRRQRLRLHVRPAAAPLAAGHAQVGHEAGHALGTHAGGPET